MGKHETEKSEHKRHEEANKRQTIKRKSEKPTKPNVKMQDLTSDLAVRSRGEAFESALDRPL